MIGKWIQWFLVILLAVFFLGNIVGCGQDAQVRGMTEEFSRAANQISTSMTAQTAWQNVTANLDGQVVEPGLEAYAGILYVAGGRVTGASGQVGLRGEGSGVGEMTPELRAALIRMGTDPSLADQIIELLTQALEQGEVPPVEAVEVVEGTPIPVQPSDAPE